MTDERPHVTIVGAGGIAGHLVPNLCHLLHAERRAAHVVIVDGDDYEEANRTRMRFGACENKAVALARECASRFGDVLTIEPVPEYVTAVNVTTLIGERNVVLLAVDNHATRRLIDERCAALGDVTLVSGGNDGVDDAGGGTLGNVQIVRRAGGLALTNSLGRFHPEIREPRDRLPGGAGCAELIQRGASQLLVTNLAVASAMLNAFHGLIHGAPRYEEVYLDVLANRVAPIERPLG